MVDHDPAAMLQSAILLVKAAGYRVSKPSKPKVKDRVGPTFVATFADGEVTRMSTFTSLAKLDVDRGMRLSLYAYESRIRARARKCGRDSLVLMSLRYNPMINQTRLAAYVERKRAVPAIARAHFEQDGAVLASYDFAEPQRLAA